MVPKNSLAVSAIAICFALAFMSDIGVAQSTKQSNPPPKQQSEEGQGATHPDNIGYNDQHPSTSSAPSTELSVSDQPQMASKDDQPKTQSKDSDGDGRVNPGMSLTDVVNMFFAGIVAFFTAVLAYVSWRQTKLMENQSEAFDNQTKLMANQERLIKNSERAFVFVNSYKLTFNPYRIDGEIQWTISATFENSGNTPAKNMRIRASLEIRDDALPDDFPFSQSSDPSQRTIGPRGSVQSMPVSISSKTLHEAKAGKKHVYIWGWAKYSDILDDSTPHITTFCCKIIVDGDPRNPRLVGDHTENVSLTFENHKNHNDAN